MRIAPQHGYELRNPHAPAWLLTPITSLAALGKMAIDVLFGNHKE
jgi:hypothetical protein